jgi:integral membrane protein (TIGR01906 family)
MKLLNTIVFILFILCIPVLIATSNVRIGVSDIRLYEHGFDKYDISSSTGIERSELTVIARHLIDYFNLKTESAQMKVVKFGEKIDLFNEKELIHLDDVRALIQLDHLVQLIAIILALLCIIVLCVSSKDRLARVMKGIFLGCVVTLAGVIVLVLWALFGFDQLFILFHLVSFSNDLWLLDPTTDNLIQLFPGGFFYDAAVYGFIAVIAESLILGVISFIVFRRKRISETRVI